MTLSTQQVQRIFELVKLHIPFYDLQVEMVDHLASSIEEQIEQDSSLSFEQALQIAYATFGSSSFKLLIKQRRESLVRQKWTRCFQLLKEQLFSSQFYYSLRVFVIVYFISIALPSYDYFMFMLTMMMFYGAKGLVVEYFRGRETRYKLLLSQAFRGSIIGGVVLPQLLFVFFAFVSTHTTFSILVTCIILLYRIINQVNKESINKAKELYPEAFVKA